MPPGLAYLYPAPMGALKQPIPKAPLSIPIIAKQSPPEPATPLLESACFLAFLHHSTAPIARGKKHGKIPKHAIRLLVHASHRTKEVTVTNTGTRGPHTSKPLGVHSHRPHFTIRKHFKCPLECRSNPLSKSQVCRKKQKNKQTFSKCFPNLGCILLESSDEIHKYSLHYRENSQ